MGTKGLTTIAVILTINAIVQVFALGFSYGIAHQKEEAKKNQIEQAEKTDETEKSERLESVLLVNLIREYSSDLKNDKNKATLQRSIATILANHTENTFREDDLHYLMFELRKCMIQEKDPEEKAKLKEIYDREQEWMAKRRRARQEDWKKNNVISN